MSSYLDPGGEALVSADGHATILPVVLAGEEEDSIEDVVAIVERADGEEGFAVDITGEFTVGRDFQKVSEEDLQQGRAPVRAAGGDHHAAARVRHAGRRG